MIRVQVLCLAVSAIIGQVADAGLPLNLRSRSAIGETGRSQISTTKADWDPKKTAIVVCDMWDHHTCPNAERRVGEMAPRMNEVLKAARNKGVFVIHCPSGTMKFYEGHPGRKLAQAAPVAEPKRKLEGWCYLDKDREGELPIDDSDGGCDCETTWKRGDPFPWTRQNKLLEIMNGDAITDSAEAYYLMRQRGIENVIVMGVHTNMCVLGRPFSIRQLVYQGLNVALMRDLTDTMYNPEKSPFVSHFMGTDLVVAHIEKNWCPTLISGDFLDGKEYRFPDDKRPHLVIVSAEDEYKTEATLPKFAAEHLGKDYRVTLLYENPQNKYDIPNLEVLDTADVLLVSVRRRPLPAEQLDHFRKFVAAGKPVVGIRTASHAFSLRDQAPPAGLADWKEFDAQVFGGNYTNHHGNELKTAISILPGAKSHPILKGIEPVAFPTGGSLYMVSPLAKTAVPLLEGKLVDKPDVKEPVAWLYWREDEGRSFYTSLGHPADFESPQFQTLLKHAIAWAAEGTADKRQEARGERPEEKKTAEVAGPQPSWSKIKVPGLWEDQIGEYDGFAWYRCAIQVPAEWKGRGFYLYVDKVDNACESYFNGTRIGVSGGLPPKYASGLKNMHRYVVSADLVKFGEPNTIAIRVYDNDGKAGFKGIAPLFIGGGESIDTQGEWQFRKGDDVAWAKEAVAEFKPFDKIIKTPALSQFATVINRTKQDGPLPPAESRALFTIPEDLEVELVLSEPNVAQPLFMNFDERGRLWVLQYLQYPEPAGLTLLSKDQWWRAVYDKVPLPPPHGDKGADKITIHEDTDGDGAFDSHKTFVDGLNIATSFAQGRGGVYVLNPPYLLFYPDKDRDDVPDGDPEVLLSGFGLEDTHSVVNSLRWGPDGWLYGAQGSTVSAAVKRPGDKKAIHSQGQNIWRFHPETKIYEIFAEGGGNSFSVEFDAQGRVFSGHNGGNTRGFHYIQGAYLQKGFGKHGPLSNPYTFGYFPAMEHGDYARFTHNFAVYEGDALPEQYFGKIFAVNPIMKHVVISDRIPVGSTFKTKDVTFAINSADEWFRPVDVKDGPDGNLYVADWYDGQLAHTANYQGGMDREHGRVWRIKSRDPKSADRKLSQGDLAALSDEELWKLLQHPNRWQRETARRLLGDRRQDRKGPTLAKQLQTAGDTNPLEAFWGFTNRYTLSGDDAISALAHPNPQVRLWTWRLWLDQQNRFSPEVFPAFLRSADKETQIDVLCQIAATAKRCGKADQALPLVSKLLTRSQYVDDPQLPLLVWWAVEAKITTERDSVLALFRDADLWREPLVEKEILPRLMRRFAATGQRADLVVCAELLKLSPSKEGTAALMRGFDEAFAGRSMNNVPPELVAALAKAGGGSLSLRVRQGDAEAIREALATIADPKTPGDRRSGLILLFGEVKRPDSIPALLDVLTKSTDDASKAASLGALSAYNDERIAPAVLGQYTQMNDDLRSVAQGLLVSRKAWAKDLLAAVDQGKIAPASLPEETVRKLSIHKDEAIAGLIKKHFGEVAGASTEEMQAQLEKYLKLLAASTEENPGGDPYPGKALYTQMCGKCHKLHDAGGQVGPDLTSFKRDDVRTMLLNIINPSAEIREGFETFVASTTEGRVVTGFLVEQDPQVVVLRTAEGQTVTLDRDDIDELLPQKKSIMPEGQLKTLTDEQVRDLFAYLRSGQPLPN